MSGGKHVHRPDDVDRRITRRLVHRDAHVDLGREVEHQFGPEGVKRVSDGPAVADIEFGQPDAASQHSLQVGPGASAQVIDDQDVGAVRDQRIDDG